MLLPYFQTTYKNYNNNKTLGTQGRRYVNAVGFLEDLCLGNIAGGCYDGGDSAAPPPICPDTRTFNLVLATLASGGKWKKALDLSAPMRVAAYGGDGERSGARGAGGRGGRERAATAAANRAVMGAAVEMTADGETYTHLIVACGKGGEPDRCVREGHYKKNACVVLCQGCVCFFFLFVPSVGRGWGGVCIGPSMLFEWGA